MYDQTRSGKNDPENIFQHASFRKHVSKYIPTNTPLLIRSEFAKTHLVVHVGSLFGAFDLNVTTPFPHLSYFTNM